MFSFAYIFYAAYRNIRRGLADEQFRQVFFLVATILGLGTLFYWRVEHWSLIDSFYFSVVTLATVGFGDLSPTTAFSKLFTALYVIVGVGILVAFYSRLAFRILADREKGHHRHERKRTPALLLANTPRRRRRWRVHSRRTMPDLQNARDTREDQRHENDRATGDPEGS